MILVTSPSLADLHKLYELAIQHDYYANTFRQFQQMPHFGRAVLKWVGLFTGDRSNAVAFIGYRSAGPLALHIEYLFVAPPHRRKKYGWFLVYRLIKQRGQLVTVDATVQMSVFKFYTKCGFMVAPYNVDDREGWKLAQRACEYIQQATIDDTVEFEHKFRDLFLTTRSGQSVNMIHCRRH